MSVLLPSLGLTYCMGENLAEIKLGKLLHKETHKNVADFKLVVSLQTNHQV